MYYIHDCSVEKLTVVNRILTSTDQIYLIYCEYNVIKVKTYREKRRFSLPCVATVNPCNVLYLIWNSQAFAPMTYTLNQRKKIC